MEASLQLVNPNVVDLHALRPDRFIDSFLAAPRASHCNVENEMKWLIKWPLFVIGRGICEAFILKGEVMLIIDERTNLFRCPFNGVNIECCARVCDFNPSGLLCADRVVVRLRM